MKPLLAALVLAVAPSAPALAAEKVIKLKVENMDCASCGSIVKRTLARIQGVMSVIVDVAARTASVVFDDARTDVAALTVATTKAGYPATAVQ